MEFYYKTHSFTSATGKHSIFEALPLWAFADIGPSYLLSCLPVDMYLSSRFISPAASLIKNWSRFIPPWSPLAIQTSLSAAALAYFCLLAIIFMPADNLLGGRTPGDCLHCVEIFSWQFPCQEIKGTQVELQTFKNTSLKILGPLLDQWQI